MPRKLLCLFNVVIVFHFTCASDENVIKVRKLVKLWSQKLGADLYKLSSTMTRKEFVMESFEPLEEKISKENGEKILDDIADKIRAVMSKKENAAKRISEYAEYLSYIQEDLEEASIEKRKKTYNFFNADTINQTTWSREADEDLDNLIFELECEWWCKQKHRDDIKDNIFTKQEIRKFFKDHQRCDYDCDKGRQANESIFYKLPLLYDYRFDEEVNLNISVVKVATNIYERDDHVLNAIEWSEALDLVFKENFAKDRTLRFQYFASPLGFMRNYPAIKWSQEDFYKTYDPRTRSWYTEAITSPKDVIILLDRSGSMATGFKRFMAKLIVNDILDTLNDNDFVNIYTFTNTTEALVDCFNNTLVQANEENLRLLRENLPIYENEFKGELQYAVGNATILLKEFRPEGSRCNQIIMIITEMLESDFERDLYRLINGPENYAIRMFTYEVRTNDFTFGLLSNPGGLRWIACVNRGHYSNITRMSEVREAVLNYTRILSRPINYNSARRKQKEAVWSYLQIDLADRRYSNWLWKKFEGNRQREVFIDHIKRQSHRMGQKFTSAGHILLKEEHDYEQYQNGKGYDYLTTVSIPVFGRKKSESELIGVAAVDVPINLFKSQIMHHRLGVNGYAFILTNNGYILMHPNHRREFKRIPKPTYNRVDFVEVEIMDDSTEPRLFNASTIVKLREDIVKRNKASNGKTLKVKYTSGDMKRILHGKRTYFYTDIGPFNLGVALPHKYGLMVVKSDRIRNKDQFISLKRSLLTTKFWTVHPDWVYCEEKYENKDNKSLQEQVKNCLDMNKSTNLLHTLLFDANATKWFEKPTAEQKWMAKSFNVSVIFIATHTGLTRWYNFTNSPNLFDEDDNYSAVEEDWYRRTVEENFSNEESDNFIYSAPFEISSYEENLITCTNAIFLNKSSSVRTPVAVIGLQFDRLTLLKLYLEVINNCGNIKCDIINCTSLDCYILDNNAYVVIADSADTDDKFDIEFTGRYFGDLRPDIMNNLVKHNVFKATKMFDYQAICYNVPKGSSSGNKFNLKNVFDNIVALSRWIFLTFTTILMDFVIGGGPDYVSIKPDTLTFQNLTLQETLPTPCDHEMTLFTLNDNFESSTHTNITCKFYGNWQYVVQRIPNSNLLFMALNTGCKQDYAFKSSDIQLPTPIEITTYDAELPCYIAKKNKYTRMSYMTCDNRSSEEDDTYNLSVDGPTEGPHCGLRKEEMKLY